MVATRCSGKEEDPMRKQTEVEVGGAAAQAAP